MNKKICLVLLILAIFTLNFVQVNATHIAGGQLTYKYLGNDTFLITVEFYRDCGGIGARGELTFNFTSSCGHSFSERVNQSGGYEVSQLCEGDISNSTCNGGVLPGMEKYIYKIKRRLQRCDSWTVSVTDQTRNNTVLNIQSPGSTDWYVEGIIYNSSFRENSSPIFTSQPIPYICSASTINYSYGVQEIDGDSLVYSIDCGKSAPSSPLVYVSPFSCRFPIQGITIDPVSGILNFVAPTTTGNYVVVVCVDEYDKITGQLKGRVCRDIQFVVVSCLNVQPQVPVSITNFNGSGNSNMSGQFLIDACVGDFVSFDLVFSDPNTTDSLSIAEDLRSIFPGCTVTISDIKNPLTVSFYWDVVPVDANLLTGSIQITDNSCSVKGINFVNFSIRVAQAAYAGGDVTICQGDSITLQANGGENFLWRNLNNPIVSYLSCTSCENPVASPPATTEYLLIATDLQGRTFCKIYDTVTITVGPNYSLTTSNDTTLCFINDLELNTIPSLAGNYTYKWTPSIGLNDYTLQNPISNPNVNTQYIVEVTSDLGCKKKDTVNISLTPPFPKNSSISPIDIVDTISCAGDNITLNVDLASLSAEGCRLSTLGCPVATNEIYVGAGTQVNSLNSGYPSIWGGAYKGVRNQFIIRASELSALGFEAGRISSIAFFVQTIGTRVFNNFTIKMGCTNQTHLLNQFINNLTEVISFTNYTVVNGWNTFTFTNNEIYEWDGVSNLVIETCFLNDNSSSGINAQIRYTPTSYNSVVYSRSNHDLAICNSTTDSRPITLNNRPNIKMTFCSENINKFNYLWLPGNNNTPDTSFVLPNSLGTYTYNLVISDTFLNGCVDTATVDIDVVSGFDASFDTSAVCLNEDEKELNPIVGNGIWNGIGVQDTTQPIFSPSVAGIGRHPIKHTLSGNCASDTTLYVTVLPMPDVEINPLPKQLCKYGGPYQLEALNPGGVWSGTEVNSMGMYNVYNFLLGRSLPVYYTVFDGRCYATDTMIYNITQPYEPKIIPIEICSLDDPDTLSFDIINVNVGEPPYKIKWTGNGIINDSVGIFNPNITGSGQTTVTVEVSDLDGSCSGTASYTFSVLNSPLLEFPTVKCSDITTNSPIIPTVRGGTWTINPIPPTVKTITPDALIPSQVGVGNWEITYFIVSPNGCETSKTDTFRIVERPSPPIVEDRLNFCVGDSVILRVISADNINNVIWYNNPNPVPLLYLIGKGSPYNDGIKNDTSYKVWVTESLYGCQSPSKEVEIYFDTVNSEFKLSFVDTSSNYVESKAIQDTVFYGYSDLYVKVNTLTYRPIDGYIWNFNFDCDTSILTPSSICPCPSLYSFTRNTDGSFVQKTIFSEYNFLYLCEGRYKISLITESLYGCRDTAFSNIEVRNKKLSPNIFTPNGDGYNDYFKIVKTGLLEYNLKIFSRWGLQVYEQTSSCSINDKYCGWNGKINGKQASDGVYFWVFTGKTTSGKTITEKGNLTLIGSK